MSTQNPDFPSLPADDEEESDLATTEVDGEQVLDTDADPDLVDSADADRLAAEAGETGEIHDQPDDQ